MTTTTHTLFSLRRSRAVQFPLAAFWRWRHRLEGMSPLLQSVFLFAFGAGLITATVTIVAVSAACRALGVL